MKENNNKKNHCLPPFIALCVMGMLCFFPMVSIAFVNEQLHNSIFNLIALLLLSILLILLLVAIGGRKFGPWFGAIYQLFLPAELASVIIAKSPITFGLVQSAFQTNIGEASELAGLFFLVVIITLFSWAIYLWAWISWNEGNKQISKWFRLGVFVLFLFYSIGIFAKMYLISNTNNSVYERIDDAIDSTRSKYIKVFPYDIFYNTIRYIKIRHKEKIYSELIGDGKFDIISSPEENLCPIVVFVIGEASNVSHWQLFGYKRQTTPFLSKRKNIILFEDVLSSANLTSICLPMLISRSTPKDFTKWQKEGTLMHLFKKAGFYTAWLGNQSSQIPIVQVILKCSDYQFHSGKEIDSFSSYDEILLPKMETYLQSIDKENRGAFVVVHTMGSHFFYDARYPQKFDIYKPNIRNLSSIEALNSKYYNERINSYDNTIVYTDYILDKMIFQIDSLSHPAVLVYIADHGEALGEINPSHKLHGSQNPLRDELEVPLLIAYNSSYAEQNKFLISILEQHKRLPISATDVPALLVRLAGVISPQFPVSVGDKYFRSQHRYYLTPRLQLHSED